MQSRGGGLASTADEVGAAEKGKNGRSSIREWPTKLSKVFCLFLTLGVGVLLGIVASLHLMGYFRDGMMSSLIMAGAPATHQQHVHLHVIAANDWQSFHHNMGDEELLWRASMVPHRPGLPVRRTPKVAFMFLTVGAIPLAPLWEKFFKGHQDLFNIYIHSLPDYEPSEQPTSVFFGRHVLSRVCHSPSLPYPSWWVALDFELNLGCSGESNHECVKMTFPVRLSFVGDLTEVEKNP